MYILYLIFLYLAWFPPSVSVCSFRFCFSWLNPFLNPCTQSKTQKSQKISKFIKKLPSETDKWKHNNLASLVVRFWVIFIAKRICFYSLLIGSRYHVFRSYVYVSLVSFFRLSCFFSILVFSPSSFLLYPRFFSLASNLSLQISLIWRGPLSTQNLLSYFLAWKTNPSQG